MTAATQEAGFSTNVRGKSVTALEIEFGVLKSSTDQRRWSFFYIRDPLPYERIPSDVAAMYHYGYSSDSGVRAGHDRLQALKAQRQADPELGSRVHAYRAGWDYAAQHVTDLAAWGEMVFQHLWAELDEETRSFASRTLSTPEQQERAALEEFVVHRRRDFTGREEVLAQLHQLATGPARESTSVELEERALLFLHIFH